MGMVAWHGTHQHKPAPPACVQLIQGKLADMYAATQATRSFVYQAARDADAGGKACCAPLLLCSYVRKLAV